MKKLCCTFSFNAASANGAGGSWTLSGIQHCDVMLKTLRRSFNYKIFKEVLITATWTIWCAVLYLSIDGKTLHHGSFLPILISH
jgi:hypothetical protein